GEIALGIAVAAVEHAEPCPFPDELAPVTQWARHARRLRRVLLYGPGLWVPPASPETSRPADPPPGLPAPPRTPLRPDRPLGPVRVPDVPAVRVVRAPDELAVPAELHLELPGLAALLGTQRAELIELLRVALERVLRLLERALERAVELLEHLHLTELPLGDVV